jgi:hypothetical protein
MASRVSTRSTKAPTALFRSAAVAGFLIVAAGSIDGLSHAQGPTRDDAARIDLTARNPQPAFLVRADVNHTTRDYRQGDALSVRVTSEVDAYLYVLYQQADSRIYQIFPNVHQPDNRVPARRTVEVPGNDDAIRWQVGPPFGDEVVKVIASKRPIAGLADPALRQGQFNAVAAKQLKGIELELGAEPPAEWAEHDVKIHTYPRTQPLSPAHGRRYAIFFGVSEYEFNAEYELSLRSPMNLPTAHRNAKGLAEVLREVGQLDEFRIFTNEQATRQRFQDMVTGWLPSVSRPGDTVVIFFSGHGMQIADDEHDEADGKDEVICPHDQMTADIVGRLLKKEKLDRDVQNRVQKLLLHARQVLARTGSQQQSLDSVIRQTGITDDEFAVWLQKLDGRQVIVVLNACNSGGFAQAEKGDADARHNAGFDFLDREVVRLKDLGQSETVLLTACSAQQSSLVRPQKDFSVMPYYLIEFLRAARGPVDLVQCYQHCEARMKEYFESPEFRAENEKRRELKIEPIQPHQPQLYNQCGHPAYLKP